MTEAVVLFVIVLALLLALYWSWRISGEAIRKWTAIIAEYKRKKANERRTS